jgi:tRNA(Ile)-lysidine synthase
VLSKFALQIRQTIGKTQMLEPDDRVVAGVSGGADSVCLLLVLQELGCDVAAAHLNHGLRGSESDQDEAFTRDLAERLAVPFFAKTVSLKQANVEAAGRAARREFFRELAETYGFTKIALAHTRDDRVETFVLNLLRGSGLEGLVSMAAISESIVRPLIDVNRDQVEDYLEENRQLWRTDASNFDLSFARNRVRHQVIPLLASEFNPNLVDTLARTITVLEAEDALLRVMAKGWIREELLSGERTLDANALASAPLGLVRRVIREALRNAGSELHDVTFDHIESIRSLLGPQKSGKLVQVPGGMQAAREFDRLVFRQTKVLPLNYDYQLDIPGSVHIPELGKTFRAEIVGDGSAGTGPGRVIVDGDSIGPYVRIRNWKPGDYYRPVGSPAGKLKKLFQRARIPRSHRANWPVLVADSTIVWVASFPVSRDFAPGGSSQRIVAIEALPVNG